MIVSTLTIRKQKKKNQPVISKYKAMKSKEKSVISVEWSAPFLQTFDSLIFHWSSARWPIKFVICKFVCLFQKVENQFKPDWFQGSYLLHLILTALLPSASNKWETFSCLMTLHKASLQLAALCMTPPS